MPTWLASTSKTPRSLWTNITLSDNMYELFETVRNREEKRFGKNTRAVKTFEEAVHEVRNETYQR